MVHEIILIYSIEKLVGAN